MPHYVKPMIYGDSIRLEFSCTEAPGSDCKIACPVDPKDPYGCETFSLERDEDGTPWHVGYRYDDETDEETDGRLHQMVPTDRCLILEWDDLGENYAGDDGLLREGEVTFHWEGDYYEWKYKDEIPGRVAGPPEIPGQTTIHELIEELRELPPHTMTCAVYDQPMTMPYAEREATCDCGRPA